MQLYDLTVTSIPNSKARLIVARLMATYTNVPLHEALMLAGNPPVVLFSGIDSKTAEQHARALSKFGVKFNYGLSKDVPKTDEKLPEEMDWGQKEKSPHIIQTADSKKDDFVTQTSPAYASEQPKAHKEASHGDSRKAQHSGYRSAINVGYEKKTQKNARIVQASIVGFLFFFMLFGLFWFSNENQEERFRVNRTSKPVVSKSANRSEGASAAGRALGSSKSAGQPSGSAEPGEVTSAQAARSDAFIDSAKAVSFDHARAINFYRIAISFNRYNLHAWHGLVNTYREAGMVQEMRDAQKQMEELFGESINSVSSLVNKYGELRSASLTENGVYRVEYITSKRDRDALLRETYTLTKALRNVCDCESISLFASGGRGKGMIVHVDASVPLTSLRHYENLSSITFLE
ncbi:hypothetical protein CHISP_2329 [Chitinispirillum alkaliphilum]|nr:hypothetical protein CHISP_2329 [Chitinispirillum alkaliphilum]